MSSPVIVNSPVIVVSVHDVAPATAAASRRWAELLDPLGVPLSFLIVPGPWRGARFGDRGDDGEDLAGWLRTRQQGGDEITVHGWCHRADLPGRGLRRWSGELVARGAAEFWALDRTTAGRRSADGLEVLGRHGLQVIGTTPPGWLAGLQARRGMADAGLEYTTDHTGLVDLRSGRRWTAPALCQRPCADTVAPSRTDRTLEAAGRSVVSGARLLVRAGRSVRIAVHPADLDRPGLAEATVTAVRRCLEAGAAAATYQQVAERLRCA